MSDSSSGNGAVHGARPGTYTFGDSSAPRRREGYGLGLDAGGTYTDAALLDLATHTVVAKAKAPTTPRDLAVGVAQAVGALDAALLARVSLVSLSTTLATNALVEDRGARVGLLLMPVTDAALAQIATSPVRVVPGKLSVDGREIEPIDPDAVREAAAELLAEGVDAFAVSGYGGANNPVHEQAVKAVLAEITVLPVVCGHELTGRLDFVRRAHTAVLNARLMPVVSALLDAVQAALTSRGVHAPLYVVRGDGSLVRVDVARRRPIETILSGPAASVVGARFLTGEPDLVVVDIGGTTTDVAVVEAGRVRIGDDGATVGTWRTSVTAADLITTGLGGDSHVHLTEGGSKLTLGPGRVQPLSFTALEHPAILDELAAIADEAQREPMAPIHLEFFTLAGPRPRTPLTVREERLLAALESGPRSRRGLAVDLGALAVELLPSQRLESLGVIRRCAFTPSDALHVLDRFNAYDGEAARLGATVLAAFARRGVEELCAWTVDEFARRVAHTVVRRELSLTIGDPDGEDGVVLHGLLDVILGARTPGAFGVAFTARRPLVGLGAPAHAFLPAAAALLGARAIVPPHAEVANAVGAITGRVTLRERVRIQPESAGGYVLVGPIARAEFGTLGEAQDGAAAMLVDHLRRRARHFGTGAEAVTIQVAERRGLMADGGSQFLELVVEGVLEGEAEG